jgi:hypothetical protein
VTAGDAAYGEWEWWAERATGDDFYSIIIASQAAEYNDAAQDGYYVAVNTSGRMDFSRVDNGAITLLMRSADGLVSSGNFKKYKVTRDENDEFSIYYDDTLVTAATGSNPVTDATYTASNYWVFENDTMGGSVGPKIGLVTFEDLTENDIQILKFTEL